MTGPRPGSLAAWIRDHPEQAARYDAEVVAERFAYDTAEYPIGYLHAADRDAERFREALRQIVALEPRGQAKSHITALLRAVDIARSALEGNHNG